MATLAQLRSEPYWDREVVTAELDWLGDELCRRAGRPRTAAGTKGNEAHLRGAHRSQEWIVNSHYCTNRTYTVQPGLTATQARHIAGFDFTPGAWGTAANRALMVAQTKRLCAALKAGQLAGVREVIGTLDGRNVVGTRADGSTFSSDDSHLEHWHLTFDRRRCADRAVMERIVAVALGEDDDMTKEEHDALMLVRWIVAAGMIDPSTGERVPLQVWGAGIDAALDAMATRPGLTAEELGAVRAEAMAGAAAGATQALTPEALAAAIPDDLAAGVADLLAERLAG